MIHLYPINVKPVQPTIKADRPNPFNSLSDLKFQLKIGLLLNYSSTKCSCIGTAVKWSCTVWFALNHYGRFLLRFRSDLKWLFTRRRENRCKWHEVQIEMSYCSHGSSQSAVAVGSESRHLKDSLKQTGKSTKNTWSWENPVSNLTHSSGSILKQFKMWWLGIKSDSSS